MPRVLSELFQNRNYLYFVSDMINTDIFVSFKFRKICKYAFCSLLTLKATGQIHSTWFWPRGFSYFLSHFKGKCINILTFDRYSIIFNTKNTPKSPCTMLPNGRIISPATDLLPDEVYTRHYHRYIINNSVPWTIVSMLKRVLSQKDVHTEEL